MGQKAHPIGLRIDKLENEWYTRYKTNSSKLIYQIYNIKYLLVFFFYKKEFLIHSFSSKYIGNSFNLNINIIPLYKNYNYTAVNYIKIEEKKLNLKKNKLIKLFNKNFNLRTNIKILQNFFFFYEFSHKNSYKSFSIFYSNSLFFLKNIYESLIIKKIKKFLLEKKHTKLQKNLKKINKIIKFAKSGKKFIKFAKSGKKLIKKKKNRIKTYKIENLLKGYTKLSDLDKNIRLSKLNFLKTNLPLIYFKNFKFKSLLKDRFKKKKFKFSPLIYVKDFKSISNSVLKFQKFPIYVFNIKNLLKSSYISNHLFQEKFKNFRFYNWIYYFYIFNKLAPSSLLVAYIIKKNFETSSLRKKQRSFLKNLKSYLYSSDYKLYNQIKGIKISVKGRINKRNRSFIYRIQLGSVPLSTLSQKILYTFCPAFTLYGSFGIKVWIAL